MISVKPSMLEKLCVGIINHLSLLIKWVFVSTAMSTISTSIFSFITSRAKTASSIRVDLLDSHQPIYFEFLRFRVVSILVVIESTSPTLPFDKLCVHIFRPRL